MGTAPSGPLAGLRVIDLTRLLPGGYLTMLLADLGADVVKVEQPGQGDYLRNSGVPLGDESAAWWMLARGKRSVVLDLKDAAGVQALLRVIDGADCIIESFRPGVTDRLGVGYAVVRARNPAAVYASLSAYGERKPEAALAGHDINAASLAGVVGMTGPPGGPPCPPAVQVADLGGAMLLAIGLLAAVHAARQTGVGDHVTVSMYEASLSMLCTQVSEYWATNDAPGPGEHVLTGAVPCYGVYECGDGKSLSVGALEAPFWESFCARIGREDLALRAYDPAARSEVAETLRTRPRDAWVAALDGADACATPVLDLGDAVRHPLAVAMVTDAEHAQLGRTRTLRLPIRLAERDACVGGAPPAFGADTYAVLRDAGLSDGEIVRATKTTVRNAARL